MHKVYLHVRGVHPFKDHHTLYVPSLSDPKTGKSVHCEGSPLLGFAHVVERAYDPTSQRSSGTFLLGDIDDAHVADANVHAIEEGDRVRPVDGFERVAFSVPAPAKSLRSANAQDAEKTRVRQENCQTWVKAVLERLVEVGMVKPDVLEAYLARMQ